MKKARTYPAWINRRTWIVVADSRRARILAIHRPIPRLAEVAQMHAVAPLEYTDAPGRSYDSGGMSRHSMSSPTSPKEHSIEIFARQINDMLSHELDKKSFDHLVIIAEPNFLGALRQFYTDKVAAVIAQEIGHDLAPLIPNKLVTHLATEAHAAG